MKVIHNKLVRDHIISIIENQGRTAHYKRLDTKEYQYYLKKKLIEEAKETNSCINKDEIMKELADVLEVIDGLCLAYDIDYKEIIEYKEKKADINGKFNLRLFLESVED